MSNKLELDKEILSNIHEENSKKLFVENKGNLLALKELQYEYF